MGRSENANPWPPVDMVLRTTAVSEAAAPSAATQEPAAATGDTAASAVDPADVAERVFRMMQRDLRIERERLHRAGGRRWRSSP